MTTSPVQPGDVLAGKYQVERVLGQGGMGVVVAARHVQLEERVAIKFLLPAFVNNENVVTRFLREGKAAVRIRSEHIARVSDVGKLDNGAPYMVMEYLDGCDLGALVQRRGPIPYEETIHYVLQACEALAEAHALGIVHRDLKPPNLFLTHRADGSPCVKVLDFGIAKFSKGTEAMTKTGGAMGSALYMSPEQLSSAKDVDARTDIWALGVILFEMLSGGEHPFSGDDLPQLIVQVFNMPASSLRALHPEVPAELEAVILCCLEKQREGRFRTIAALASALLQFSPIRGRVSVERIAKILKVENLGLSASPSGSSPELSRPILQSGSQPQVNPSTPGAASVHSAPAMMGAPSIAASPMQVQTAASWGGTHPEGRIAGKSKLPMILGGLAVCALIGGAVLVSQLVGRDEGKSTASEKQTDSPTKSSPDKAKPSKAKALETADPTETAETAETAKAKSEASSKPSTTKTDVTIDLEVPIGLKPSLSATPKPMITSWKPAGPSAVKPPPHATNAPPTDTDEPPPISIH